MENPPTKGAIVRVPAPEKDKLTWEEQSGFLEFLGSVSNEVKRFDSDGSFGLRYEVSPPETIDGSRDKAAKTGFLITRRTDELTSLNCCLYSVFSDRSLKAFVGVCNGGRIDTVRELEPLENFDEGTSSLYDWLRELLGESCRK